MARRRKGKSRSRSRRLSLKLATALVVVLAALGGVSEWYVHHPRPWLNECHATWPKAVTAPLFWLGNPLADLTDALDWTGHDAVYEYDEPAPTGAVSFAGLPRRVGAPAPADIRVLDRGEFKIGWSDTLRHPVWCAYHVTREARFPVAKRPSFLRDRAVASAPMPDDYTHSGYDRGHMTPNYAIQTRYGETAQRLTFLMSNIAPQSPALNRGVWRDVEHRIADLWTARYGEIWVVVGCISSPASEKLPCGVDVPDQFYQIIIAQEKMDVRAQAVLFNRNVPYSAYAARNLVTISELEKCSGLNFNPELPSFIQDPLEQELPSRLWPICPGDVFKLLFLRHH